MTKRILFALLACLCMSQVWADDAFRNHRYDSFRATKVTNQSVVFVGNSITNMQPWAELFTADNVINRGNSGGFSWEILSNIQSFITGRPAKVFIMIGTNDMNVAGYTPEAVAKNVRQAIKHIQKESPATQVYVESVMPSTNNSRTVAKGEALNAQLQTMATEMGVTFVDFFDDLMGITSGTTMSYDALHPHVGGVSVWAKKLMTYVGGAPLLAITPNVVNGGQSNSYGARYSVHANLPINSNDVLFIGDEFVHGGEWQELLGNPNVKNRGTGWGKWGPDITVHQAFIEGILKGSTGSAEPKQVVMMLGSQNLTSGSSSKEDFKTKYGSIIEKVRDLCPNTQMVLVSMIPYGTSATSLNKTNLVPINEWLQEQVDADVDAVYCDLYSILTSNDVAKSEYIDSNQYVTGLGYQACARELAKYIDGCTVMSETDAVAYYNLIGARKSLSNVIDVAENTGRTDLESTLNSAYSLLATDGATIAQLQAMTTTVMEALRPTTGKWYKMNAARSTSVFFTKSGSSLAATATPDAQGNGYWQLVDRSDGTYDIKNGKGYYAVPTATHNVQLSVQDAQPTTGWTLETCDAAGAFNVVAKVGTTSVNCCMNLTASNTVYNWITGRASDTGCQVYFTEVSFTPQEEETYNVPFQRVTVTDGAFTGAQWWYNVKIKNLHYLRDQGSNTYMPLDRMETTGDDDEQWAFAGSDQKGYTIYNKKYGTAKVLAAPSTISGDGGSTYAILVDASSVPTGYETKWQFAKSTAITGVDGYFMYTMDQASHKVNNYAGNNKLAFWTGGADAGSTLSFELSEAVLPITKDGGQFYRSGIVTTTGWVSQWKSNITEPYQITFGTTPNNMNATSMGIAVGQQSAAWTFALSSEGYYIQSYSFKIKGGANDQVLTPAGGTAVSLSTTEFKTITWTNDAKGLQTAQFAFTGSNKEATLQDMVIVVRPLKAEKEPQTNLFEYGSEGNDVCYRIPAIATAQNGNVIALTDYRYGGKDIGFGRVSLRYRISKDNGATWGDIKTLQESRQGSYGVDQANDLWAGFGDPCVVADRESNRVLAMACCGNVSYPAATYTHHQGIARFRSEDGGETWTTFGDPVDGIECHWQDIADPIYKKFKDGGVDVAAMFVGSGRIFQSRFTKVGDYYRIYCVVLLRTPSTGGFNYVLYSDDFGENWNILGGDKFTYGVSGGDEPKSEELPDGSILLSSRANGRIYNIFHFTDVKKGLGSWMTQALSTEDVNGICRQGGNPTNGEIMVLPVVRKSDNKKMWMALQSVPFGPNRANVGIYYKELDNYSKFSNPANFAKDWTGRHQSSYMSSAYSTMTLQKDNHIGFMYEESTFGKDYTQVYKSYTIEDITDDAYSLDTDPVNPMAITADGIDVLKDGIAYSSYVGGLSEDARSSIEGSVDDFKSDLTQANYLNIFSTIANATRIGVDVTKLYIIRNTERGSAGANAMYEDTDGKFKSKAYNTADATQYWALQPIEGEDGYFLLKNNSTSKYYPNLPAKETAIVSTDESSAGRYRIEFVDGDKVAIVNRDPSSSYTAIHAPGDFTSRMVAWNAYGSPASLWYFEKTDVESGLVPVGGDVNNDGTVDEADIVGFLTLKQDGATAGLSEAAADKNFNGMMDYEDATILVDLVRGDNPNHILHVTNAGQPASYFAPLGGMENIAVNGNCYTFRLVDGKDYVSKSAFTATNMDWYQRTVSSNWGTIALPYEAKSNEDVQLYALKRQADNTLVVSPVATLDSNTPGLFRRLSTDTRVSFEPVNFEIADDKLSPAVGTDGSALNGVYANQQITDADTYYIKSDKFYAINSYFSIKPFRAYVSAPAASEVREFSIVIEDQTTGIDTVVNLSDDDCYTLSGQRVGKPAAKGVYIRGGKKVVVK